VAGCLCTENGIQKVSLRVASLLTGYQQNIAWDCCKSVVSFKIGIVVEITKDVPWEPLRSSLSWTKFPVVWLYFSCEPVWCDMKNDLFGQLNRWGVSDTVQRAGMVAFLTADETVFIHTVGLGSPRPAAGCCSMSHMSSKLEWLRPRIIFKQYTN
jgi:hypothetical protein